MMHGLTSAMCWLILGTWLVPAFAQPAEEAQKKLQGTWTATKAERDGEAADDVVGHRLSFAGNRFTIRSKEGKLLYAGTVRVDQSAKPAAMDFEHAEGALKGKAWKGIYALDGDTLRVCDNAPNLDKGRPAAFEAKSGSGHVLVTFRRAKP
ncbi:MAG TPA: TIGR03067 domain-containing protein [Methylomirabilota bacterium]|nr:TIGR03067 domain-containing protein [Methylomirabilota bacterium]